MKERIGAGDLMKHLIATAILRSLILDGEVDRSVVRAVCDKKSSTDNRAEIEDVGTKL